MTDVDRHQQLISLAVQSQEIIAKTRRQLLTTTDPAACAGYNQIIEENNSRLKEAQAELKAQGLSFTFDENKHLSRRAWNISHPRNPNFTGRQDLLEQLRTSLLDGRNAIINQGISSPDGIGKSELALEYVYRLGEHYQLVWWLRAGEPLTLGSDLAALATALELPERAAPDQDVAGEAVRRWLAQNDDWLLIFDDAPAPDVLKSYIPATGKGHLLITSSFSDWDEAFPSLEILPFSREESVEFLLKRTSQADAQSAANLAELLGDLPLALELAGAYIKATAKPLATYLSFARDHMYRLRHSNQIPPASEYPLALAASWELAYEQLRLASVGGVALLNLCAFFAPENIPLALILDEISHLPETLASVISDDLKLNEALGMLERFALVKFHEGKLALHPLVQMITRQRLNERDLGYWASVAARLMNAIFPYKLKTPQTWTNCAQLLPHALAAAGHAEALGVALDATGRLLNQLGLYVEERGELEQAKTLFERAVTAGITHYGPNHANVAIRLNNLGNVLHELGELESARALYERALTIDETAYGPNDPNVAIRLNNLGNVLHDLDKLEEAQAAYERALTIDESRYGPDHPKVAIRLNNLGDVKRELGELAEAKTILQRALAIDETGYGPSHPNVAIRLNNLGNVLQDLGELPEAKAVYERALVIDEANFGGSHPTVAFRLYNLGVLLGKMDNPAEASAVLERALEIFRQILGEDHPNTQLARQSLQKIQARPVPPAQPENE